MIEFDVFEELRYDICEACVHRKRIWVCSDDCPFKDHFAELRAKCKDIEKDASYLSDLASDDNSVEYEDYRTEEERDPWSHFAMKGFY